MPANKTFTDNISTITTSTAQQPLSQNKTVRYTFTGTYTGVTAPVQVSNDGTNYVNIMAQREDTGAGFTGSVSAANFSVIANVSGWAYYRLNVTAIGSGTLVARADEGNFSLPPGVAPITVGSLTQTITSTSANALAVGANGTTNPALNVDASAGSVATGWNHVGAAAASGAAIAVISSGTNESGTIDAKGTGSLKLNSVGGTGFVQIGGAGSGNNATGLKVTPNAAASGLAIAVVSTGTNENATLDAKGSGTITLNGTATGNVNVGTGLIVIGATAGLGYGTGAGGAVTQATSRTTGVTLNKVTGSITLVSAAGSATPFSFTVTNSTVAATDTVIVSQKSGTDKYTTIAVTAVAAGSFQLTLANASGTTTEQPVFNFCVIKGVAA